LVEANMVPSCQNRVIICTRCTHMIMLSVLQSFQIACLLLLRLDTISLRLPVKALEVQKR
jgi:hypothetical protein